MCQAIKDMIEDGRQEERQRSMVSSVESILFEVKTRKKFNEMQEGLEEAYRQIRDMKY